MPSGSEPAMVVIFSLTICRARNTSMPQSNSAHTKELPKLEPERTRLTFVAPLRAVSIGKVTRRSTSSDAMPWQSVITTTVGAVRSGNTSTSIFCTAKNPPMTTRMVPIITANLWWREKYMILSIIVLFSLSILIISAGDAADTGALFFSEK